MKDVPFVPLTGAAQGATVFTCALCGARFTHGRQTCGSCPLATGCDVVACPNCGHSFPRRSWLVERVQRLAVRLGARRPEAGS